MDSDQLKLRTKSFALRIMKMVESLPNTISSKAVSNQVIRSGTSVGANYRAACRARSKAEFIAKIRIVIEEADGCGYWLEIIEESGMLKPELISELKEEASELTAIFMSSSKTASSNKSSIINFKS